MGTDGLTGLESARAKHLTGVFAETARKFNVDVAGVTYSDDRTCRHCMYCIFRGHSVRFTVRKDVMWRPDSELSEMAMRLCVATLCGLYD